jgi:hypothetical protein
MFSTSKASQSSSPASRSLFRRASAHQHSMPFPSTTLPPALAPTALSTTATTATSTFPASSASGTTATMAASTGPGGGTTPSTAPTAAVRHGYSHLSSSPSMHHSRSSSAQLPDSGVFAGSQTATRLIPSPTSGGSGGVGSSSFPRPSSLSPPRASHQPGTSKSDMYNRVAAMSVVALRAALADAKVLSSDCVEKVELQDRLLAAIAAGYRIDEDKLRVRDSRYRARSAAPSPRATAAENVSGQSSTTPSASPSPGPSSAASHGSVRHHFRTSEPELSSRFDGNRAAVMGADRVEAVGSATDESAGNEAADLDEFRNWASAIAPDGQVYYYHRITRSVRWDMPDRATALKMEARISEVGRVSLDGSACHRSLVLVGFYATNLVIYGLNGCCDLHSQLKRWSVGSGSAWQKLRPRKRRISGRLRYLSALKGKLPRWAICSCTPPVGLVVIVLCFCFSSPACCSLGSRQVFATDAADVAPALQGTLRAPLVTSPPVDSDEANAFFCIPGPREHPRGNNSGSRDRIHCR